MRLSNNEKRILIAASVAADKSAAQIARAAQVKHRTAHTVLNRLSERKIVSSFWLISPEALGLIDWCLFIAVNFADRAARSRLNTFLKSSPAVAFAAELSGEYHYTISLFAARPDNVSDFVTQLGRVLHPSTFTKTMAARISWTSYSPNYLMPDARLKRISLVRGITKPQLPLDLLDRQLLSFISASPDDSLSTAARSLQISPQAVYYRLASLRARGIVLGKLLLLHTSMLGIPSFRLLIRERSNAASLFERLSKFALSSPNVTGLIQCVGAWDYELNLELTDPSPLNEFLAEFQEQFRDDLHSVVTIAQLNTIRISQFPFDHNLRS